MGGRSDSFFRREVYEHRGRKLAGSVIVEQPRAIFWAACLIAAITVTAIVFLLTSEYSRKERVRGEIGPVAGLIEVVAEEVGVIDGVPVGEGDIVSKGQPLLVLRSETHVPMVGELHDSVVTELESVQASAIEKIENEERRYALARDELASRVVSIDRQMSSLRESIGMLEKRVAISNDILEKLFSLREEGYASELEARRQEDAVLSLSQQLNDAEQMRQSLSDLRRETEREAERVAVDHDDTLVRLEAERAEARRQLVQARARQRIEIRAPVAGRVSGFTGTLGQKVGPAQVLMNIVPEDSGLQAVLIVPSTAVGFVELGQAVQIRVDSFPHQRFGVLSATIVEIGGVQVRATDAPAGSAGGEPTYRVLADLHSDGVVGYGRRFALRPGMEFEADVITERRSLLQWLFDPVFSLKGRMR